MTEWEIVHGSQTDKPSEFDTTSSPTTVYQRRDIKRITVNIKGNDHRNLWQYYERKMTHDEYLELRAAQNAADIDYVAMETGVEL